MGAKSVFHPPPNRPHNTQNSIADVGPGSSVDIVDTFGRVENAKRLFYDLRSAGVVLSIDKDGRLSFDGPDDVLRDDRLSVMRAHRDDLLAVVESFEERAAVAQYDGGLSRADAERLAMGDLHCKTNLPKKQIVVPEQTVAPEPVEMPEGIRCPYCPGRSMIDDAGGCRCVGCGRLAWVSTPGGGIVRADYEKFDL